ncbi:unnamed protein product [Prorocentrum cordatum]|uniref:Uncharacterized protein n=1 Tax=Prorocentrum cordatum TaxID=2364126 RepID=A0ABN9VYE7_9DINO|nr:unnamed protein product [Polarella glacialis]
MRIRSDTKNLGKNGGSSRKDGEPHPRLRTSQAYVTASARGQAPHTFVNIYVHERQSIEQSRVRQHASSTFVRVASGKKPQRTTELRYCRVLPEISRRPEKPLGVPVDEVSCGRGGREGEEEEEEEEGGGKQQHCETIVAHERKSPMGTYTYVPSAWKSCPGAWERGGLDAEHGVNDLRTPFPQDPRCAAVSRAGRFQESSPAERYADKARTTLAQQSSSGHVRFPAPAPKPTRLSAGWRAGLADDG